MDKKEYIKQIIEYTKQINIIQRKQIVPLENKVTSTLKKIYPKLAKEELEDWTMDIIYNLPDKALTALERIYNKK